MMIDWNVIDTVLFDMDGTLLDLHFDNHFWLEHLPRRYAEIHGRDERAAREELVARFRAEQGTLNWYCVEHWSRELGVDIRALKEEVSALIAVRPHVETFLSWLHDGGKHVLLVTNAHRRSLDLKLYCTGIGHWFDELVSSHDIGLAKEQRGFWTALQALHPFDPVRTLLIDDSDAVLQSAHDHGIRHLLTMSQPDSRGKPRSGLRFPAILHFDEIMPEPEPVDGA